MTASARNGKFREGDWREMTEMLEDADAHLWDAHSMLCSAAGSSWHSPIAFAAKKTSDPDTLTCGKAMSGDKAEHCWNALSEEMINMEKREVWEVVPREEALDAEAAVVPSTWAFKRKCRPDKAIKKCKSRFCIRGGVQKKVNKKEEVKEEAFAPAIAWSAVRLVLMLSITLKLKTHQIDFSNAFTKAKSDKLACMDLPERFTPKDGSPAKSACSKLKHNLCESCIGPALWCKKVKKGLENRGFAPSVRDPCLFASRDVTAILYVDCCVFVSRDEKHVERVAQSFVDDGDACKWKMTAEGDLKEFLGVNLERVSKDGDHNSSWKLTQRGLVDNILEATDVTNCGIKPTPAAGPFGKDKNGPEQEEHWHCASAIGMSMHLANNSCPDCAFATHQ